MSLFARYTSDVCYYLFSDTDLFIMASNRAKHICVRGIVCIHTTWFIAPSNLDCMHGVEGLDPVYGYHHYIGLNLSRHDTLQIETSIVGSIAHDGVYHRVPDPISVPIIKQFVGHIKEQMY